MTKYGRSEDEWDQLVDAGHGYLVNLARSRVEQMTSYSEVNNELVLLTGLRRFDFDQPSERAAIGHLLGLIVDRDLPSSGAMLSALVLYADGTDAGPGFYTLAKERGLLPPGASKQARDEFWLDQVRKVRSYYTAA